MPVTIAEFRRALGQFATGVTVVTVTRDDGSVHGMTANSFASVSLEPLQILVCVAHRALTYRLVNERGNFGINVLSENQEEMARFFALPEQDPQTARQLGVAFLSSQRGTPLLDESLVQLDCRLVETVNSGDHAIFIGEVVDVRMREGKPLLFHAGQYKRIGTAD